MGKNTASNNEMEAILNQLKKSYNLDGAMDSEDEFDAESSYEDSELSSLLAKIISEDSFGKENDFSGDGAEDFAESETKSKQKKEKRESSDKSITSEAFVSVLESGEDISEGAKYTNPPVSRRAAQPEPVSEPITQKAEDIQEEKEPEITDGIIEQPVEDTVLGDLEDEPCVGEDTTFGDLEDEPCAGEDTTFGNLEDEPCVGEDTTFGDLEDEPCAGEDTTFGDLEDEPCVSEDTTFDDLEDEPCVSEDTTFGDLEDEPCVSEDTTFGDLEDESEIGEDVTFGDIEEISEYETEPEEDVVAENTATFAQKEISDYEESKEPTIATERKNNPYYALLKDDEYYDIQEEQPERSVENSESVQTVEKTDSIKTEKPEEIILSRDEYTDDPLQWHFESHKRVNAGDIPEDESSEPQKKAADIGDDDISLLLQLGYKKELNDEVGTDRTDFVVQSITNSYRPDRNKIPFGFCGKEFSEKEQIPKIKQKYDSDKRMIIIKTALFSAIAAVLLILSILIKDLTGVKSMIMFPIIEIIIIGLGCTVIYKELLSGIVSVFKFSPNIFAIPVFSVLLLALYDIMTVITAITKPDYLDAKTITLFGFTSALFLVFALVSQLLNCIREQRTFNLISSSEEIYVGEILESAEGKSAGSDIPRVHETLKFAKGDTVAVKKSKYISEYFKRTSESTYRTISVGLAMGLSLIFAMIFSIIIISTEKGNSLDVVSTFVFTFYICLSASFILTMPVMLFAASKRLNEKNSGFVGTAFAKEYSNVQSVVFPDTSAAAISGDIEVIPFGDADMNESLKISDRFFSSLGGTVYESLKGNQYNADESVSPSKIKIISINDDGVELIMDTDTHILFGNKKFILSYRTKFNMETYDFIPQNKTHGKEVAYLAINKKLCLGYVMSLKYKKNFLDAVQILADNKISTLVSTYEPHIRSARVNNINIGVYKPYEYEAPDKNISRSEGIIATGDSSNIAYPLIMSKEVYERSKKASIISWYFIGAGIIVSLMVTLIGYLVPELHGILKFRDVFTVIMQLAGILPSVVLSVQLYEKYK